MEANYITLYRITANYPTSYVTCKIQSTIKIILSRFMVKNCILSSGSGIGF